MHVCVRACIHVYMSASISVLTLDNAHAPFTTTSPFTVHTCRASPQTNLPLKITSQYKSHSDYLTSQNCQNINQTYYPGGTSRIPALFHHSTSTYIQFPNLNPSHQVNNSSSHPNATSSQNQHTTIPPPTQTAQLTSKVTTSAGKTLIINNTGTMYSTPTQNGMLSYISQAIVHAQLLPTITQLCNSSNLHSQTYMYVTIINHQHLG